MDGTRKTGIDIVKSIAIFSVISVHFFLHNGFYGSKMQGAEMFISTFIRWASYICVPLFIITTGYLMSKKEVSLKYYKGLLKVIISYLIISVLCIIFRIYYLQDGLTWFDGLKGLFIFSTNPYSWYVNLYIGLFLLIPFLNILYNNIKKKREKDIFIATLILLTAIPKTYFIGKFVPDWWGVIYPLTYYFIGVYLKEYKINISKLWLFIIAIVVVLLETLTSFFISYGNSFIEGSNGYGALPTVIVTTAVFLLFYNVQVKNKIVNVIVANISKITLEIYLLSYIVDMTVYPFLRNRFSAPEMIYYYILIVPSMFIIATLLALIINFFQKKLFKYIIK